MTESFSSSSMLNTSGLQIAVVYMLLEILRALSTQFMMASKTSKSEIAIHDSILLFLVEFIKLLVSLYFVIKNQHDVKWKFLPMFMAHSFLYFLNNSLYYYAFSFANADAIQFLLHMRLPLTAALHHFIIKRQYHKKPWLCLAVLFIGVLCTQVTEKMTLGGTVVFVICFTMSVNSAMAAIYNEKLLKSLKMEFWEQQLCVYLLGSIWAMIYAFSSSETLINTSQMNSTYILFVCLVIGFGALSGLSVGFLIKKLDNIVKLIANAVATIIIAVSVVLFFGKGKSYLPAFLFGSCLVLAATYFYAKVLAEIKKEESSYIPLKETSSNEDLPEDNISYEQALKQSQYATLSPVAIFRIILLLIAVELIVMLVLSKTTQPNLSNGHTQNSTFPTS